MPPRLSAFFRVRELISFTGMARRLPTIGRSGVPMEQPAARIDSEADGWAHLLILQPAGRIEVDDAALEIDPRMHRQLGDGLCNRSAQPKTTVPHSDSTTTSRARIGLRTSVEPLTAV
jgi:hypothetical protein